MGANYNCILVKGKEQDVARTAVAAALQRLGYRVVYQETPRNPREGFQYRSNRVVFISPGTNSALFQIAFSGEGWGGPYPTAYVKNPLALSLSNLVNPVVDLWSYDSGFIAGYGIYQQGFQIEAQTLAWRSEVALNDFEPELRPPVRPTRLGDLLGDPTFNFEQMARGYQSLEVAMAALAERLGVDVHLLDNCDVQDGDGGIVVIEGEYRAVDLPGWFALYYDRTVR